LYKPFATFAKMISFQSSLRIYYNKRYCRFYEPFYAVFQV